MPLPTAAVCLGAVAAVAAVARLNPAALRPGWRVLARVVYRFRARHPGRVPAAGPALVVCNHVSYLDWLALWAAAPRTPTFVAWADEPWPVRVLMGWARTVRVPRGPHAADDALRRVAAELDAGRLVVMFPEGKLSRTGNMHPFGRGVERVLALATAPVAVVPASVAGLWGSVWSWRGGRPGWKLPHGLRRRVSVYFAEPVPQASTAVELRAAVQEAMADGAVEDADAVPLVHQAFVRNAARFSNLFRPCIYDHSAGPGRVLTWGKTYVGAACVAGYLRPRVAGDTHVGVWLPTGLGGALANLALALIGKPSVNLNYTAGAEAVRSACRQAGVRTVVTARRFTARVPLDLPDDVTRIYLEDVLESVTKWGRTRRFLTVLLLPGWALDRVVWRLPRHRPDDVLTVVFSSGSTGEPKGIVLTHRNVGTNNASFVDTVEITSAERLLNTLPFFHSFGYTVGLWGPLGSGASAVYYPDPRQAKEVGEICRTRSATLMVSTATFLRFYLRRCGPDDFKTLRLLICGAEKLPVKLQEEFRDRFGVRPLEGYGCTELSPVVCTNLRDIPGGDGGPPQTANTPGTVGQPIFGVCTRAFDPDARTPLPPGVEGVLWVRGPNVMAGYLHREDLTKRAVTAGWYDTGDRGLIEPDGFIRITGRLSRFAKIAGEMVPLERVEEELHDALAAGGERLLAVAAVPDERRGERVVVLHLPDLTGKLAGPLSELAKRGLPNLWVPDERDCYPVDSLPLLGSGKLDLRRVGDLAKELAAKA